MEALLAIASLAVVMLVVPWLLSPAAVGERAPLASGRERRLWVWTLVVVAAIFSTIGVAQDVTAFLRERNLLRVAVAVVGLAVLGGVAWRWTRRRPGRGEVGVALGVAAVYLMGVLRIRSWEERTHLFEYGVVAVLVYAALAERRRAGRRVPAPAVLAWLATAALGWLDEGLQAVLPGRVYDLRDVGFNALAAFMALGATLLLTWARRRFGRRRAA